MRKNKRGFGKRLCSLILTGCMLLGLVPVSALMVLAAGDAPVSLSWEPQIQTKNGVRQVKLSAALTQSEGDLAAAMIEIYLDADEAKALQWGDRPSVEVGGLEEEPEDTTDEGQPGEPGDTTGEGQADESDGTTGEGQTDEPEGTTGGSQPGEPGDTTGGSQTGESDDTNGEGQPGDEDQPDKPDAPSAVLVTGVESGGAVLRILLTTDDDNYLAELSFTTELSGEDGNNVSVEVAEGDVLVHVYSAEEGMPNTLTAPLLTDSEKGNIDIELPDFPVFAALPPEIEVSAQEGSVSLDDEAKEGKVTYEVSIQKPLPSENGKDYTFTIKLPDSLSLPSGDLTYHLANGLVSVSCGGTLVGTMELGKEEGAFIKEDSLAVSDNAFSFTITVPANKTPFAENETYQFDCTLSAGNLVRSAEKIDDMVTLTVSTGVGEESDSALAAVTITAEANVPGEGGWTLTPTQYKPKTQPVFWADNNDEDNSRPHWSTTLGDTESGMTPRLYFTLTEVDENWEVLTTFQPEELTRENLKKVGLTDMPDVSEKDGSLSVTVEDKGGLPSALEERDDNDNVRKRYTVSWSLEPPEVIPDEYTLQNIEDASEVEGVSQEGWYFVLLDDFTITVDVQQGEAGALTEEQLLALMDNFTFHWQYDGKPESDDGQSPLKEMLDNGLYAEYDPEEGTLTVSGLWRYSISGAPITYYLTETADDGGEGGTTADGRLSGDELEAFFRASVGEAESPLEHDDWYDVRYDNTGVENYGNEDDAVYSGGKLILARGGETQYTATKIWRDEYTQNDKNADRPEATFTLYRYLWGTDPGSAVKYDGGVEVKAVWVPEKSSGEGFDPGPGGEEGETQTPAGGRWEIRVINIEDEGQENPTPAQLPQYDSLSGREWIYVVVEAPLAGYEQVFGEVTWDDKGNKWEA